MDAAERDALLALVLTPGFGQTLVGRCVEAMGSAQAVLGASAAQLAGVERIGAKTAGELRRKLDETLGDGALSRDAELRAQWNVHLVALGEPDYPRLLSHIPDPPRLLWVRGGLREDDALALAIVGARKCSHYGREQADRFASQCAQAGLCIVSGGAYGIDAAAHRAALRVGGRTVAVLGSGLARPYPEPHRELFDQIAAAGNAVVSEFPMGAPPIAENFPRRNRIISGLSLGVLVVEAARRSGALITARLCVEEQGREAMAVPGRLDAATSEGCHKIIQEGWARLVTNAADVLDSLGEAGEILKAGVSDTPAKPASAGVPSQSLFENNLTEPQQAIVSVLHAPRSLDELAAWTKLPVQQVQAELTMLEIRGTIRRERGLFVRRKERV